MARRAGELPNPPIVDVVDDGLTEDEIAARFAEWLADLESVAPVDLDVGAAEELHRADDDDDV
jgi:hypothetical protein